MQAIDTNIVLSNLSKATLYFTSGNITSDLKIKVSIQDSQMGRIIVRNISSCIISNCQINDNKYLNQTIITTVKSSLFVHDIVVEGRDISYEARFLSALDKSEVIIQKSNFTKNKCPGGLLSIAKSSHVSISNSYFAENLGSHQISGGLMTLSDKSSALIEDSKFIDNNGVVGPSIMGLHHSKIQISNSIFIRNIGCAGGAVGVGFKSTLHLKDSTFKQNSALLHKYKQELLANEMKYLLSSTNTHTFSPDIHKIPVSKILMHHYSVPERLGVVQCNGGSIFSHHSTVVIDDSKFDNNSVSDVGGAIYAQNSSYLSLTNCTVHGNKAVTAGGGIFVTQECSSHIDSCLLMENHALQHGALTVGFNSALDVHNSTFFNNTASDIGAIGATSNCTVSIKKCVFLNNSATLQMGTIAAQNMVKVNVTDSIFDGNKAGQYYAAIRVSAQGSIAIHNCIFKNSKSSQCTLYLDHNVNGFISNSSFINNKASALGNV